MSRIVLCVLLMFGLATAGIELTRYSDRIASVWLANGAILAVMIRSARDEWPLLGIAALAGNLAANLLAGDVLLQAVVLSFCNLLEIGIMALLLGDGFARRPFENPQSLFRFAGYAAVVPLLSGALAAATIAPSLDWAAARLLGQWYVADALGLMMLTPPLLAWSQRLTPSRGWGALVEPGLFVLASAALSAIIFSGVAPSLFLLGPLLLFAGLRLGIAAAALVAAATAGVAIFFTVSGMGPIAGADVTAEGRILMLQAFFAVALLLTIPVSASTRERDRLAAALVESERQFRLMAEASPAGILQCAPDGTPLYLNRRWTELTGTGLDVIRARGWISVIAADDRGLATALWQQARGRLCDASDTFACDMPGRPTGWADLFITPERDHGGAVVGWVVRLMDVTDRIVAGRALQESEAQYRLLADNMRDIVLRIGLDGTILFVSPAARSILGQAPAALVGKPLDASIHPDDWPAVDQSLQRLLAGAPGQSARYRQRCANGRFLWVEAVYHLVRDPANRWPLEVVASVRDVDLRQKRDFAAAEATMQLSEANRLLTMAEEMAGIGHWHVDSSGRQLALSSTAAEIAGIAPGTLLPPATAMQLFDLSDRWKVRRALVAAIRGKASPDCRVRLVRGDGSMRNIDFAVQLEQLDSEGGTTMVGVVQDITQQVAAERQLVDALETARQAADAKSRFLANMSHEIRTPMTGVLGMIDLLREDPSEEERESFLATLKQSASLLMAVLDDVLDFSKLEHGGIEIKKCDFDFEALAQSTLDLFFNAASSKGLLISLALDPGVSPLVNGDPVRIQQIMSNLISNGIKFTDSGSVLVRIKAKPAADGCQKWRIEVRDTGIGIAPDQAATLFDPFTQADQGHGRRFGGTGLGLAISRQLIEMMGGELGFDSKPGKGSTFWFELTLDEARSVPERVRRSRPVKPARSLRVLVAEDNPVNQLLVSALLRRDGHQPICVGDGLKAVEAAAAEHFDCILMDMQMPHMDGITATRTIRQSGSPCADVPIIALTADASPERRRFYDNGGLTDFMTKPIDGAALGSLLATIAEPAPMVAEPQAAAFDQGHLDRLRSALGPKRLDALLDLFLGELSSRPDDIRDHLLAGRLDQARREAHSLKGAALSIGAEPLGNAALAIERLAEANDIKANAKLLDALEHAVTAARAALADRLERPGRATGASA